MNEKLTTQDIIDLLASKDIVSRKDATLFIKELFQVIEEGLETDQIVKIKGLGTFKLVEVESRESINVNTGERFMIEGHNKISFIPDTVLKDSINKPFAHFETVILNDGVDVKDIASEQFSVIEDYDNQEIDTTQTLIEKEITEPVSTFEETNVVKSVSDEETDPVRQEETIQASDEVILPETINEMVDKVDIEPEAQEESSEQLEEELIESVEEEITDQVEVIIEPAEVYTETEISSATSTGKDLSGRKEKVVVKVKTTNPADANVPVAVTANQKNTKAVNDKKNNGGYFNTYLIAIILTVVFLCGITIFLIYHPEIFRSDKPVKQTVTTHENPVTDPGAVKADTVSNVIPVPSQPDKPMVKPDKVTKITSEETTTSRRSSLSEEDRRIMRDKTPVSPDYNNYEIIGHKTDYQVKSGETLTRVSLRFYGTKDLWPYIYEYNRSVLKAPELISAGMKLRIPELKRKSNDQ